MSGLNVAVVDYDAGNTLSVTRALQKVGAQVELTPDPERVASAFRIVLSDDQVGAVLINIFAGINRCDWVAEGVIRAMEELDLKIPVVVRLSGTNVEEGQKILAESTVNVITTETLAEAAEEVVGAWKNASLKEAS